MIPLSGALSGSQIGAALGVSSPYSLHNMSKSASFSTPDAMSEFRAYPFVASGAVLFLDANDAASYGGSGTTWYDLSGNGYNATLSSAGGGSNPSFTTSGSLKYFQFTGVSPSGPSYTGGGYMNISSNIDINYGTIQCWFNNNTSATYVMILGGRGYTATQYQPLQLYLNGYSIGYLTGRVTTGASTSNTDLNYAYSYNTWYNLATTYDGSTIKLYLNGALITSASKSGTLNQNGTPFRIGAQYSNGSTSEFLNGAVGSMLYYNRALTANEILLNYSSQAGLYGYGSGGGFYITTGQSSGFCGGSSFPNLVYGNGSSFFNSTRYFTDAAMTTAFNGGNLWYADSTFDNGCTVKIDSSGYQTSQYCC